MERIDKVIFGDNQFFGINHMSQEKAQQLSEKFHDIKNIYKAVSYTHLDVYKRQVSILCTTIIALFFVWNNIVSVNVEEKVAGAQSGSFFVRQADVIAGLSIAAENPVIGIGANTDRFKQMRSKIAWQGKLSGSKTKDSGTTNGIISLMYIWGIPFSLWYLWALIRQNILYKNRWLMAILLILSLSSEPLAMTPFFLLFVYSGLDAKTINN